MVNSNLVTFALSGLGGFLGALIGSAYTKTSYLSAPLPTLPVTAISASRDMGQLQSQTVCAPAPACPRCEEAAEPSSCPECPASGPAEAQAGRAADAEGNAVVHAPAPTPKGSVDEKNYYPLRKAHNRFEYWYDQHHTGKGVWKWTQYFPAWERHFAKFIAKSWAGEEVHMAELGIFSGGSLEMWQHVFGPGLRLWGCDIATVTKQYENDDKSGRTKIFNMDQTSAGAWTEFKKLVPKLDILIDDGLHLFSGQKATFDNILDHIAPGGVFMTEDISDGKRPGAKANFRDGPEYAEKYLQYSFDQTRPLHYEHSRMQKTIDSIHYYPYLFVVEKRLKAGEHLDAIKHGTLWKPISRGVVDGEHAAGPAR